MLCDIAFTGDSLTLMVNNQTHPQEHLRYMPLNNTPRTGSQLDMLQAWERLLWSLGVPRTWSCSEMRESTEFTPLLLGCSVASSVFGVVM